jgi:hypothetical protein
VPNLDQSGNDIYKLSVVMDKLNVVMVSKLRISVTAEMLNPGRLADTPLPHCMG